MMDAMTSLNSYLGSLGYYVTLGFIAVIVLLFVLIIRSGHNYSVRDTEAHSTNYADVIKEGHGGMTAFLWVLYAVMFIWTVYYFVQHSGEFAIIFANAQ